MTVLVESASLQLRSWAAGQHQRRQKASMSASNADFFGVAVEEARAKLQKLKTPWMADNDMWYLLERSGVTVEQVKRAGRKKKNRDAS